MAETSTEKKLSLKIMVDVKANKVVFAEADNEFVDFIISLTSLPLSAVAKVLLLNKKSMAGSLGSLYKSLESLDDQYFDPNIQKEATLKPKGPVSVPLLSLYDAPAFIRYYKCSNYQTHNTIYDVGQSCPKGCGNSMSRYSYSYGTSQNPGASPIYVKDSVVYMVMDNLEIKPMSIAVIKSHVKNLDVLEEQQVQVGLQEGLAILKASLETDTVLTTVFLNKACNGFYFMVLVASGLLLAATFILRKKD